MMKRKEQTKGGTRLLSSAVAFGLAAVISASSVSPVSNYLVEGEPSSHVIYEDDVNYRLHPGVTYSDGRLSYRLPGVSSRNIGDYKSYNVTLSGHHLKYRALMINGMCFIPLREYFEHLGAAVKYNPNTRTMTVSMDGLYLTATDGGYVTYANGRPIFNFSPNVIMSNGRMYSSLESLMKIMGQTARVSASVNIEGNPRPLKSADEYYREDEVFWLARIITAEAQGETLLGQIAVGNVIMNRVYSASYPNTIYGVIFDRKYGVQFSPVLDGTIYNTPTFTATLAAMIILEGTRLSDEPMFFLNPTIAESNWIVQNCEYLYTIGNHDFYR